MMTYTAILANAHGDTRKISFNVPQEPICEDECQANRNRAWAANAILSGPPVMEYLRSETYEPVGAEYRRTVKSICTATWGDAL